MKQRLIQLVGNLKPGQRIDIAWSNLREITPYEHKGGVFGPVDQILGNIMGAAYEFQAWENHEKQSTTFSRLIKPLEGGLSTHVDPDRVHMFKKRPDGFYELNETSAPAAGTSESTSTHLKS
jgi:hypothetical protein